MSCQTCTGGESVAPCAACRPIEVKPVPPEQVMSAFSRGEAARKRVLAQLKANKLDPKKTPWPKPTLPEDGSYKPSKLWLRMQDGKTSDLELARSMLEIGKKENFDLVIEGSPSARRRIEEELGDDASRITFVPQSNFGQDQWFEDNREMDGSGDVRVPARLNQGFSSAKEKRAFLEEEVLAARRARFGTIENLARYPGEGEIELFDVGAAVQMDSTQYIAASQALALDRKVTENLSYAEGGNVLRGTNAAGAPYAIVGKDSVAQTRASLARELKVPVSEAQALRAIAYDHGVDPKHVIPVEQPGEFHLDMSMLPVGNGQVILNDAREAARLEEGWILEDVAAGKITQDVATKRIDEIKKLAAHRAFFEDMTQKDLQAAGVRVHRMAGSFGTEKGGGQMNFLNGEGGTAPDGSKFQVLMGGDPRAEAYVREKMTRDFPTGIDRLYFLPPEINDNLRLMGGLACRIKGEGRIENCPGCKRPRGGQ